MRNTYRPVRSRRFSRKDESLARLQKLAQDAQGQIGDSGFQGFNQVEDAMTTIIKSYETIAESTQSSDAQTVAGDIYLALQQLSKARNMYRTALKNADKIWYDLNEGNV